MKNLSKNIIIGIVSTVMVCSIQNSYAASGNQNKDESENFNFIKSEENVKNFIYDGSILLYGGVFLISVSIAGIVFTLWPSKKKKRLIKK